MQIYTSYLKKKKKKGAIDHICHLQMQHKNFSINLKYVNCVNLHTNVPKRNIPGESLTYLISLP